MSGVEEEQHAFVLRFAAQESVQTVRTGLKSEGEFQL
jgi:hypothetical protein